MLTSKPNIAQLLQASGLTTSDTALVARAVNTLYGNVGANLDERNWDTILASANPLAGAEDALRLQWQNPGYLLRNAAHLLQAGYPDFAPEFTYRQMGQRLSFTYSSAWSEGTNFAAIGALTDLGLRNSVEAYAEAITPSSLSFVALASGASVAVSLDGRLSYSDSGTSTAVSAGSTPLVPAGVGGAVQEGLVTHTRPNGVATTNTVFVLVGSDTALFRNYNQGASAVRDRLVVLGAGNDDIRSGAGNDTVYGGAGDDYILGNAGRDLIYGGLGGDTIEGGQGDDSIDGGAGNDNLWGGSNGADVITGGAGADLFRFFRLNTGVMVNDFSYTDGDLIGLEDSANGVNMAAIGTVAGAALLPADFDRVVRMLDVRSDTGGASAGNNQAYVISSAQSTTDILAAIPNGATNAYVVVFDSTQGRAKLYFDADWSDASGRVEVATFLGMSAADVQALVMGDFRANLFG